jgi:PAS domain S-box-containing protein
MGLLLGLAGVIAREDHADPVVAAALPVLLAFDDVTAALVVRETPEGPSVATALGQDVAPTDLAALVGPAEPGRSVDCPVPAGWAEQGVNRVTCRRLAGHVGVLVLGRGGASATDDDADALELALATLDTGLARVQSQADLHDLTARVNNAQQLANMGDYDWHIATDTNTWSNQLFRIYGHEPQSFNPSYEKFLSLIHPDDRERISGLHQHAYATGEPYAMIERIVRPDGEVRYLSSNGEVIFGEDNVPIRMRGTCIDITDRVLADRERERVSARFMELVNSAPDAIIVLDGDHRIISANQMAHELLGSHAEGHTLADIVPGWDGADVNGVSATGLDGRRLRLDVITTELSPGTDADSDRLSAVFLRDAKTRLDGEAMASRLGEAQLRRRQALEINDNVVQGLVAAAYALDQGQVPNSQSYLEQTLSAARAMMDDLLEPLDGEGLQPGDLVRLTPAAIGMVEGSVTPEQDQDPRTKNSHRVLVVDDADDLRTLLRARMETRNGLVVVGEAADGLAAVELASELQPDLVMLDLAMPRMDGLEALPLIRAAVPGVRVIVLSGFNQSTLAEKAIEAGADRYVVKGGSMRKLLDLVDTILDPAS